MIIKDYKSNLKKPVSVYINWAAYDELSDNIHLNEDIALKQFDEMIRLKEQGVIFDYYLMDAFWFSKSGGYREWRKDSWPNGSDKWLEMCKKHSIKPGLWISTNLRVAGYNYWFLDTIDEWKDSLSADERSFCLFEGGYLPHLIETLKMHADQGIKMFKFDFADFTSVTPNGAKIYEPYEAYILNKNAFISAIKAFRNEYPDVLFLAYNGYGGHYVDTTTPFTQNVDPEWLSIFDSLYCGDPRLSDIPCMNFWRSKDIYSDHMVKQYYDSRIPLTRIDNTAFMIGKSGTCYYRQKEAWRGMLILSLARGGWMNTYYGNLDLLDNDDAKWFARVQQLYLHFQQNGETSLIGGIPGMGELYGYRSEDNEGGLLLLLNPSQNFKSIDLSCYSLDGNKSYTQVLFHDKGHTPEINGKVIDLGPEQLVLIGWDKYSTDNYILGQEKDVTIPLNLDALPIVFEEKNQKLEASFDVKEFGNYRLVFQQFNTNGLPYRISGGSYPDGTSIDKIATIEVKAKSENVDFKIYYDKPLWSGLSWAVAEFELLDKHMNTKCEISYSLKDGNPNVFLRGKLYKVNY